MRISDWSSDVCSSDLSKVQLANGVALGSRLSGIDTAISNTNAAIVNEQTARSTGDQANANAITVVSTKVNGHTSSISSLQSSVNGLSARWGLKLDVNGYISGVVTNNYGSSADFVILADKFRLLSPANTALDRKSTRLNSSHYCASRMPFSA